MPSTSQIQLRLAEGGPAAAYPFLPPVSLSNSGMGTLDVQGVAATGEGVSAYQYGGLAVVTVDPGSRGPGIYNDGVVTIQCNGANCPVQVPVSLEVVPRGAPVVAYRGVVDSHFRSNQSGVAGRCMHRARRAAGRGKNWLQDLGSVLCWDPVYVVDHQHFNRRAARLQLQP